MELLTLQKTDETKSTHSSDEVKFTTFCIPCPDEERLP
jgi:hypothetical protein